jgi:N-acyl-D-amino-acid deacylase
LNIGISNGKITEMTKESIQGDETLDAGGMVVSPGFIDIHMHEDINDPQNEGFTKEQYPTFRRMALMGVTTAIGGNCGYSRYPLNDFFSELDERGIPIHYAGFSGYITLREKAGLTDRYAAASDEQKGHIHELIRKEMESGAVGLSFGFEYAPGTSTKEAIDAARVVAEYPGRLISAHFRYDGERAVDSIEEIAEIARITGVPVQVSHIGSCAGFPVIMDQALRALDEARTEDVDIMGDCYPYNCFCTSIGSAVFDDGCFEKWKVDESAIYIAEGEHRGEYCTKELFQKVREEAPHTMVVGFVMNEEEVIKAIKHPLVMACSDGSFHGDSGHPRGAGTFPRILGRYVREEKKISLMDALAKMTIVPARRLNLKEKGRIKIGCDADLVVFDPDTIMDLSDFQHPTEKPVGISTVVLKGVPIVRNGNLVNSKTGRVIRF